MIKHLVLLKLRPDTPPESVDVCLGELESLVGVIHGLLDFTAGAYSSSEGLNRGYTHAFEMLFDEAADRDAYLTDPAHGAIAEKILALTEGGIEGVLAFDFAL